MSSAHDAAKAAALRAALNERDYLAHRGVGVGTGPVPDDVVTRIAERAVDAALEVIAPQPAEPAWPDGLEDW